MNHVMNKTEACKPYYSLLSLVVYLLKKKFQKFWLGIFGR